MSLQTVCAACRVRPVPENRSVCETCYPTLAEQPNPPVAQDAKLRDDISEAIYKHYRSYNLAEDWWHSPFTKPGDREPIEHLLDKLTEIVTATMKESNRIVNRFHLLAKHYAAQSKNFIPGDIRANMMADAAKDMLQILSPCKSCGGWGTPSGEAAGLVCGNCMGTGIEPEETPD